MSKRVNKRDREHAKRDRARNKEVRREERRQESQPEAPTSPNIESDILAALAELHREHDNGAISFADFELARSQLLDRLPT